MPPFRDIIEKLHLCVEFRSTAGDDIVEVLALAKLLEFGPIPVLPGEVDRGIFNSRIILFDNMDILVQRDTLLEFRRDPDGCYDRALERVTRRENRLELDVPTVELRARKFDIERRTTADGSVGFPLSGKRLRILPPASSLGTL